MNDEKRKAMIAEALNAEIGYPGWYNYPEEFAADFALEQILPLEDRIAELERQLAVAVEALEHYADMDTWERVCVADNALAQIRGETVEIRTSEGLKQKPVDTSRASA